MLIKHYRLIITTLVIFSIVSIASILLLNNDSKALMVADNKEPSTHKVTMTDKNKTPGDTELEELINNGKPTVIYFSSEYCRDCQQVKPIIKNLEKKYSKKANFLTIDIRENSSIAKAAIKKYKILGVPMTVFVKKDGTKSKIISGYYPENSFETQITTIIEE
ncbi:MAG: thioredoxin family protein [Vampirovibrionia bacterium]